MDILNNFIKVNYYKGEWTYIYSYLEIVKIEKILLYGMYYTWTKEKITVLRMYFVCS